MIDFLTGVTLGLHLASVHLPAIDGQHNFNPGLYARAESGLTVGAYRNTLGRTSVYAGYTLEAGPFALGLGVVSGYKRKEHCETLRTAEGQLIIKFNCEYRGGSSSTLAPAVFPSVALPEVAGIVPRLSVIPPIKQYTGSTVFHLSLERKF